MTLIASDPGNDSVVNLVSLSAGTEIDLTGQLVASSQAAKLSVSFYSPYDGRACSLVLDAASGTIYIRTVNETGVQESNLTLMAFSRVVSFRVQAFFSPHRDFVFTFSQVGNVQGATVRYPELSGTIPVNLDLRLTTAASRATVALSSVNVHLPADLNRQVSASSLILSIQYAAIVTLVFLAFIRPLYGFAQRGRTKASRSGRSIVAWLSAHRTLVLLTSLSLPIQLWAVSLRSHPYDIFTQELWSYLLPRNGLLSMWPISQNVPGGKSVGFVSTIGSGFPYPPLSVYFYEFIGGLLKSGDMLPSPGVEFAIKSLWLVFLDATGLVVYSAFAGSEGKTHRALLAYLFIILNPGLVLVSLVWGQFEIVVAFFALLSVISMRREKWTTAFFFIILAVLSKQTALFLAMFVVPAIVAKSGIVPSIKAAGRSLIFTFLVLLPLFLAGLSPAHVVNVSLGDILVNTVSTAPVGIAPWQQVVSRGDFNIWPLITAFLNNQHGASRFQYPDYLGSQILGLPYVQFGLLLAGIGYILVLVELWRSRRSHRLDSEVLLLIVLGFLWLFEVMTRLSSRYLALVIPIVFLLWAAPISRRLGRIVVALLTGILTVAVMVDLGITVAQVTGTAPALPSLSALQVYDGFITAVSLLQLGTFCLVAIAVIMVARGAPLWAPRRYRERMSTTALPGEPKVSVIVLNYNGGSLARQCVDSVIASTYPNFEIVVVDNASADDSVERLRDLVIQGRVKLVRNDANLGFALGNNRGSDAASGALLLFLNNDTEVAPDALERMVTRFVEEPDLGAAQPLLLFLPDRDRINSAGNRLDTLAFNEVIGLGKPVAQFEVGDQTAFASGSALMIRKELFKALAGFDLTLKFYYTDTDLSWKTWMAGYRVAVVPDAIVFHAEGSAASSLHIEHRLFLFVSSQLMVVAKNYEPARALVNTTILVGLYSVAALAYLLRGDVPVARAFVRAIRGFFAALPEIRRSRRQLAEVRVLSDEELIERFLRRSNPLDVFQRKRSGWGYRSDWFRTRLT
jgi:GT2 family glycosyltransferase